MTVFIIITILLFSGIIYLASDEPVGVYYGVKEDEIFLSMDSDEGIKIGDL